MAEPDDQGSDQETARYRDTALRRTLNTPPQPKKFDSNGDATKRRGYAAGLSSDAFCGVRGEARSVGSCPAGGLGYSVLQQFPPVLRAIKLDAFVAAQLGSTRSTYSFKLAIASLNAGGVE